LNRASRTHKVIVMPLTIEPRASEEQAAFNLRRWAEVQADPELRRLAHRIETDRHGRILISPPPAPAHGNRQGRIATLLMSFLAEGQVVTECPPALDI
jgi:Uma2 family endonuclease